MITLTWSSLLVLFGIMLGVFLLISFSTNKEIRETPGFSYLASLLAIIIIGQCGRFFFEEPLLSEWPKFILLPDLLLFSFGPLLYLYFKSRFSKEKLARRELWHLLPMVLHWISLILIVLGVPNEAILDMVKGDAHINLLYAGLMISMAFNGVYAYWIIRLIRTYETEIDRTLSYAQESLRFFRITSWFYLSDVLFGILLIILGWSQQVFLTGVGIYGIIWLFLSGLAYYLAFCAMSMPAVFQLPLSPLEKTKYANSSLTDKQIRLLKTKVDMLMTSRKLHLNNKLKKADLLAELDINSRDLSRVFTEGFGMNFFEYINVHRVQEFIRLVEEEQYKHLSLIGIAEKAGFNSKATFYKAFKEIIGESPREYFRNKG